MSVAVVQRSAAGDRAAADGVRRIVRNGASLLLAWVLPRLFTFGAVIVAARVLGADGFGAYGTAAAFAVVISIIATLGMGPLLIRDMARDPARAAGLLRSAHIVKAVTNLAMIVTLIGVATLVLHYPRPVVSSALLLGCAYALAAFADNFSAYFQAVEQMHVWMQASAAYGLVTGIAGIAMVLATRDVVAFCAAPVAGQLAAVAWLRHRLPRDVRSGARVDRADIVRLLRALGPFAAAFIALTVYYKVGVLLLAHWRTAEDVGVYTAAAKFIDMFQALTIVAIAAVYPRLARAASRGEDGRRWAGTRMCEILLLCAVPVGAMLWLARAPIVQLLFGDAFADAVPVVALLAPVIPVLAIDLLGGYVLAVTGGMLHVAALYAGALALNVTMCALLVPSRGPTGAALSMLIAETALATGMLVVLRARAAAAPGRRTMLLALAAVVACAVANAVAGGRPGWVTAIVYGLVVCALYAAAGAVSAGERAAVRLAWRQTWRGAPGSP